MDEIQSKWRLTYIGTITLIAAFMYETVGVLFLPEIIFIEYVSYFAFFTAFYGFLGAWQGKKRHRKLKIIIPLKPDPNKYLKILTIFILIGSVAGEYWALTSSPYITYSNYGISFVRNRWWTLEHVVYLEETPDDTQGSVTLRTSDKETFLAVSWISLEYLSNFSIDDMIEAGISNVYQSLEERGLEYEHKPTERITVKINGHEASNQNGTLTWSEETHHYIISWFVCEESNRLIGITYITVNEFALRYYDTMIGPFQCH